MVNDCINFVSSGWYQYVDFFVCVCRYVVCMCLHMCVYAILCICGEAWGQGRASFSLYCCPLYFLETKSLAGPGVHGLASESLGSTSVPPAVLSLQARATLPGFYVGAGDPDSVLMFVKQACTLSHAAISFRPQYGASTISREWNKYFL